MTSAEDRVRQVTTELSEEFFREELKQPDTLTFRPVPYPDNAGRTVWRLRIDLSFDSSRPLAMDLNDELVIGRGEDAPGFMCAFDYTEAEQLGVSRQHAMLRPTASKLYIIDMGSTNGTWLNGRSIGVNMPYSLSNGDRITLGRMECILTIVDRPMSGHTAALRREADIVVALPSIARSISSHLTRQDVLRQALIEVLAHTNAAEASVWLVDEHSGDLFLEAGLGIEAASPPRLPIHDTLAGQVIQTGEAMRVNRKSNGEQIKVKTGYLVEALLYVPLKIAGITVGVLSAAHRTPGAVFTDIEERILGAIADVTAVAVQNADLYQSRLEALARRSKILNAINYSLARDFKQLAKSTSGYGSILQTMDRATEEEREMAQDLIYVGDHVLVLIERLSDVISLGEDPLANHAICDMVDVVQRALTDTRPLASERDINVRFRRVGQPYMIQGDALHLYRSVVHLIDNALRYSPSLSEVQVLLVYEEPGITIRVRDQGPGIPEDAIKELFDHFYRGHPSIPGLGLGLELVRATMEAHRGDVILRNIEDGGLEAILLLPVSLRML